MEIIILKQSSYLKGLRSVFYHTKSVNGEFIGYEDLSFLNDGKKYTIISFDFINLIDAETLMINEDLLFFDLEQVKKQCFGHSKNEFSNKQRPWSFWNLIKQLHFNNEQEFLKIEKARKLYFGINDQLEKEEQTELFHFLLDSIEKIYANLKTELEQKSENVRFTEIELFLNALLFERTKKGITVDSAKIKDYLKSVNIELYAIRNKLQLEYGIFSKTDYENIKRELTKIVPQIAGKIGNKDYVRMLKYYRNDFPLINLLYDERKVSVNKTILSRIGSLDEKRVFPQYQYFGTVTSRILVDSPSFQQLKRDFRDIILPNHDKELIYIDYSQFEAGILASEADDGNLIEMYNKEDIYMQMSKALKDISREKCKQLFFSYCYGMSKENIKKYSNVDLNVFFKQFPKLEIFQEKLNAEFLKNGYIDTRLGNRRYKSFDNKAFDIEGWFISQKIQGNASLILKKAINKVYVLDKEIEFLLPMHDAVLYQIPEGKTEEKKRFLEAQFKEAFKEICPKIDPKVEFKKFNDL